MHARIFLSCFEQSGTSASLPVWLTTRCAQRENSAAASGQTTRPCGITWGKYREFRRSCCRDEIAQLTRGGGALLKMMGCQETARRRARRDDDGATRGSDVLERARESDIGTERCPLSEPCRGRGPARACRKSPSSLPRRTASARCLASRTGSRRVGAPPSSRDRRGASRASNAGRTRAMPLPSETRGSSLEKKHPNRTRRAVVNAPARCVVPRGVAEAGNWNEGGHRYFWRQTFAEVEGEKSRGRGCESCAMTGHRRSFFRPRAGDSTV